MIHLRVYNHHHTYNYRMIDANGQVLRIIQLIDQLNCEGAFSSEAKVIVKALPEYDEIEPTTYSKNDMLKCYLDSKISSSLQFG